MKRLWIGVGVLMLLLLMGITAALTLGSLHNEMADILQQAALDAQNGKRAQAEQKTAQAAALWQRYHRIAASFADHEPLEQMDSLFAQLQIYCRLGDEKDIADACVQLASLSRDVAESHGLGWWSLL